MEKFLIGQKWSEIISNGPKWYNMIPKIIVPHYLKILKMFHIFQMVTNGSNDDLDILSVLFVWVGTADLGLVPHLVRVESPQDIRRCKKSSP